MKHPSSSINPSPCRVGQNYLQYIRPKLLPTVKKYLEEEGPCFLYCYTYSYSSIVNPPIFPSHTIPEPIYLSLSSFVHQISAALERAAVLPNYFSCSILLLSLLSFTSAAATDFDPSKSEYKKKRKERFQRKFLFPKTKKHKTSQKI